MRGRVVMSDWSTYYAEKAAGVYDDDGPEYDVEVCAYCDTSPCVCDEPYELWRDGNLEFR
jgi:hypothetical protein